MAQIDAQSLMFTFVSMSFLFVLSLASPAGVTTGSTRIPTSSSPFKDSPEVFLDAHNAARKAVGVAPLVWNNTLASYAENCANDMSKVCTEAKCNEVKSYGQNFAKARPGDDITAVMQYWLDKEEHCHPNAKPFKSVEVFCLFYTHVVSPKTTSIGCAKAVPCLNDPREIVILCNYYPRGK